MLDGTEIVLGLIPNSVRQRTTETRGAAAIRVEDASATAGEPAPAAPTSTIANASHLDPCTVGNPSPHDAVASGKPASYSGRVPAPARAEPRLLPRTSSGSLRGIEEGCDDRASRELRREVAGASESWRSQEHNELWHRRGVLRQEQVPALVAA
jgi:hypothetical protein